MIVYKGRLLKKFQIEDLSSSCQGWSLHGFRAQPGSIYLLPNWLQTMVAIDSESLLTLFPSFCALTSVCICPFLGQVVSLDLLLCTGFNQEPAVLFLCSYALFVLRDQSLIERLSNWAKLCVLLWSVSTSCQFHQNFHFTWIKKCLEWP